MLEWETEDRDPQPSQVRLERNRPGCRQRCSGPPRPAAISSPLPRNRSRAWPPYVDGQKTATACIDELRQLRWLLGDSWCWISVATAAIWRLTPGCSRPSRPSRCCWRWPGRDLPGARATPAHRFAFPVIVALFAWISTPARSCCRNGSPDYLLCCIARELPEKSATETCRSSVSSVLVMVAGVLTVSLEFALAHPGFSLAGTLAFCLSSR